MRDQHINSFQKGMAKDLGETLPQEGFYTDGKNIRIVTDGDTGQSAIVSNVQGNTKKLNITHTLLTQEWVTIGEGPFSMLISVPVIEFLPVNILGYTYIRKTLIVFGVIPSYIVPSGFDSISVIYKINLDYSGYEVVLESTELNFNLDNPIEAVGRFESMSLQRIYWTDNLNPVRTLNIMGDYSDLDDIASLNLSPVVAFETLEITDVESGGNLEAGMYQYLYRLKGTDGSITRFSQPSNWVHIVAGSIYWNYNEDPEDQTEYNGTTPGEETDKKVIIKIENLDSKYQYVEIVSIYRTTSVGQTEVKIIGETGITNGNAELTHSTNEYDIPISIDEVTAFNQSFSAVKTIEEKDNRLFFGNVKLSAGELEFNAKSYRYKRTDDVMFPYKETSNVQTYKHIPSYNNPYNNITNWWDNPSVLYKYQDDGATLGGTGEYIDFKFTKKKLSNTAKQNIPEEAPFLSTNLSSDYKSPVISENFKGYQRDEVYRFGIVLYDTVGNPGYVNWIADIRFPAVDDVDKDGIEGVYTYGLSQTEDSQSGAGLCQNYDDPNHQDMTDYFEGSNPSIENTLYDGNVSWVAPKHLEHNSTNEGLTAKGHLYALGIEFKLKGLPDELAGKVGGYSFVRMKRTDIDKSTIAVGALTNFFHYYDSSTLANPEQPYYFSANRNGAYASVGGGNTYTEDDESMSYPHQSQMNISSPEFDFTDNYLTVNEVGGGDSTYSLRVLGGMWGQFKDQLYEDDDVYGIVCGAHTITQVHAIRNGVADFVSTNIWYGEKHEIGEASNMPIETMFAIQGQGMAWDQNTGPFGGICNFVTDTVIEDTTITRRKTGVGEKCQYLYTGESRIKWEKFLRTNNELYVENYAGNEFDKLLVAIKRNDVSDSRYGGYDEAAIASSKYIGTGHFSKYSQSTIDEYQKVFGGDIYVAQYDITRFRKSNLSAQFDSAYPADALAQYEALNFAFPVETAFNITLRQGWHFANQPDFSGSTQTPLNQFILNPVYSSENDVFSYVAPPLLFNPVTEYSSRIAFSDVKINNAITDGWRQVPPPNYRDLDGNYGEINKLILYNDQMYYLQDNAFGILSINPVSTITDDMGSNITLGVGKKVIQDHKNISIYTGCKENRHVIAGQTGIYWLDISTKKAYHFNPKGLNPISDTKLMKSFKRFQDLGPKSVICLGYDYVNNEILYSIGSEQSAGDTLVYSEITKSFTSTYSFYTNIFMSLPDKLLSVPYESLDEYFNIDYSGIYEHNIEHGTSFYDKTFSSHIEFIVNKNPLYPKVFDSLEWYENSSSSPLIDTISEAEFSNSTNFRKVVFEDESNDNHFPHKKVTEKMTKLPVPRTDAEYRFRDTYLKIKLSTKTASKLVLHYVKTLFRISRR